MRITERTIHNPVADGWMQPRFHATDEYSEVYWNEDDRVVIVRGECDHGIPFGLMQELDADLTQYEPDLDRLLMWRVATNLDCAEHA